MVSNLVYQEVVGFKPRLGQTVNLKKSTIWSPNHVIPIFRTHLQDFLSAVRKFTNVGVYDS